MFRKLISILFSLPSFPIHLSRRVVRGLDRECRWMRGWMPESHAYVLSLFKPFRTQLPGETTMTPPPHTQLAHRGPPAGDTLHRAVTTVVSKVSQHRNGQYRYTDKGDHIYYSFINYYFYINTHAVPLQEFKPL